MLYGLFVKDWEAKSCCYMRELLVLSPFDVVFSTLIVGMVIDWLSVNICLEVNLLSLREPGTGWLSPSMVVIEEHVVEMLILVEGWRILVKVGWDVRDFIEVLRSDLADVKIDEVAVVGVDFEKFIIVKS